MNPILTTLASGPKPYGALACLMPPPQLDIALRKLLKARRICVTGRGFALPVIDVEEAPKKSRQYKPLTAAQKARKAKVSKAWRLRNRERINEWQRTYRVKNPPKDNGKRRERYWKNPELERQKQRERYKKRKAAKALEVHRARDVGGGPHVAVFPAQENRSTLRN